MIQGLLKPPRTMYFWAWHVKMGKVSLQGSLFYILSFPFIFLHLSNLYIPVLLILIKNCTYACHTVCDLQFHCRKRPLECKSGFSCVQAKSLIRHQKDKMQYKLGQGLVQTQLMAMLCSCPLAFCQVSLFVCFGTLFELHIVF